MFPGRGHVDDYYSYRPRTALRRPTVLVGVPGSYCGKTARIVSMFAGLPLVWVDRQAEHLLGRSVEWTDVHDGRKARLKAEQKVLDRALGDRSPGGIAASMVTFTHPVLRERLLSTCDVVHLRVTEDEAITRVRRDSAEDRRKHYALLGGEAFDETSLRLRLPFHYSLYSAVSDVIDVDGRPPTAVGQQLVDRLLAAAG